MAIFVEGFRHPQTKEEVVSAYQEEYRGRGSEGWRQHLISDLFGIIYGEKGLSPEDTKKKRKNIARRFDPSRLNNAELKNSNQYKKLGEDLPLMMPESISISGTLLIRYSKDCAERDIDETLIDEEDIKDYMHMMMADLTDQAIVNVYQLGDIRDPVGYAPCQQDNWDLSVIASYE